MGIPNALLCFEMFLVSILHIWAYPSRPYCESAKSAHYHGEELERMTTRFERTDNGYAGYTEDDPPAYPGAPAESAEPMYAPVKQGGFMGLKALVEVVNFSDIVINIWTGFHWLIVGRRAQYAVAESSETPRRKGESLSEALSAI